MTRLLVTFTVKVRSEVLETKVDINSIKKAMKFDPEWDLISEVYAFAETKAVEKLYGKGKYFMMDNSGISGRGQIWVSSKYSGSDSITGMVNLESDFYDIVEEERILSKELNMSLQEGHSKNDVIEINKKKDINYYETLCKYCADNNIDLKNVSNNEFDGCVELLKEHGSFDITIEKFYFWID